MDFEKENEEILWKKEDPAGKKPFDFDAFLDGDDLDDRVTDATDGQDVLDPEAFDRFSPDYIPRRFSGDGEHGRHEAPGQPELPLTDEEPDMSDPRYAAPERPKVVARPTVYVTPESSEEYSAPPTPAERAQAKGWGKAIVLSLVIIAAVLGGVLLLGSGGDKKTDSKELSADVTPSPEPEEETATPAPTDKPAENTPEPTEQPKNSHSIQVTAGSGGSISPSGVVMVEEGDSVTFTISPKEGYALRQLLVDGSSVTPEGTYTFSNVKGDHTIYAVFDPVATATPAPTSEPTPEPTEPPPTEAPATEVPVFETPDPEVEEGLE